jgi:hypothetical protein
MLFLGGQQKALQRSIRRIWAVSPSATFGEKTMVLGIHLLSSREAQGERPTTQPAERPEWQP